MFRDIVEPFPESSFKVPHSKKRERRASCVGEGGEGCGEGDPQGGRHNISLTLQLTIYCRRITLCAALLHHHHYEVSQKPQALAGETLMLG